MDRSTRVGVAHAGASESAESVEVKARPLVRETPRTNIAPDSIRFCVFEQTED